LTPNPYTIGITGGSGSGKTHFLKLLASHFAEKEVCLISQDHYYKPFDQQPLDNNGIQNFDLPASIERELLLNDLLKLKSGVAIQKKEHTFNNPKLIPKLFELNPAPIIIIEGLFVQFFEEIAAQLDLKIFIEAKDYLKLSRRIRRDNTERGYGLDEVLYQYENHVMPVFESLIEPLKHQADIIIPSNSHMEAPANVIAGFLKRLLVK
jgi:uridine kinase